MNYWTERSIEIANTEAYLDRLYGIYPMANNECRNIDADVIDTISRAIEDRDNTTLINHLLQQELFPIKDSYVAYLRKDNNAILRNPEVVKRITNKIYEIGTEEVIRRIREPKETNRQMGPLFNNWLRSGVLGLNLVETEHDLLMSQNDCVFIGSDQAKKILLIDIWAIIEKKVLTFWLELMGFLLWGKPSF